VSQCARSPSVVKAAFSIGATWLSAMINAQMKASALSSGPMVRAYLIRAVVRSSLLTTTDILSPMINVENHLTSHRRNSTVVSAKSPASTSSVMTRLRIRASAGWSSVRLTHAATRSSLAPSGSTIGQLASG
jgi:hypothetical protein